MNDYLIVQMMKKWLAERRIPAGGHSRRLFRPVLRELDDRIVPSTSVTSVTTSGLGITAGAGDLRAGQTATLTVNFDSAVNVDGTSGLPTLTLNDGATAAYAGGTGTTALNFSYLIKPGDNTPDLAVTAFNLNGADLGGANVSGAATNPTGTLKIDTTAPTATITLSSAAAQAIGAGLQFNVTFSEPVLNVDKTDFALAATGVSGASIGDASTTDHIHYTVTVASGSGTGTLGLNIAAGNTIIDNADNALGGGTFSEAQGSPLAVGSGPRSVVIGDVNGDGKPDLVIANTSDSTVSVLLGNGDGSFTPAASVPVGTTPASVAVGDVDGDGNPDIVTANFGSNNVSVSLGNGNGSFTPAATVPVGTQPISVVIGDVDGDGKPDLVTANRFSNSVSVSLGNGNGSFTPAPSSPFAVGDFPSSVAVVDVNGDGKPDLVVANQGDSNVSVSPGNGDGSFGAATNFPVGSGPHSVAVVDVNGDGKPDLVTANYARNTVSVSLGNGNGSFQTAANFPAGMQPISVAVGDLNGDGSPDIVTDGDAGVSVLSGNGDGSFLAPVNIPVNGSTYYVAIGDVNDDGRLDIVAAKFENNNVSVLLNGATVQTGPAYTLETPSASVTSVTASGLGITAGTGDLRAGQTVTLTVHFDAAVTADKTHGLPTLTLNDGATAAYSGGSGTSALTFVYTIKPGDNTDDLAVTAFNLNGADLGVVDLSGAVTNPTGTLKIDTTAPTATITLNGAATQAIGAALKFDVTFSEPVLNVDKTDFALAATGVTGASIGEPSTTDHIHYTVTVASGSGAGTLGLNIADTNDIKDSAGNALGGGAFADAQGSPLTVGQVPQSVSVGDVNGDGKPDLVTANFNDNTVSVLLGNGDGTFAAALGSPVPVSASRVKIFQGVLRKTRKTES
ncbi:beta strand repeat-containing protein [Zavarzinella formosa]|uniref:beta strand repeat-containing protein n=1 Tax=Zavarzinella formosa TaxID=360055 RepID=UPI0002E3D4D4|nr:FG-GAP-like repeat-containing protein [Zavarzinella formosa]